jgi:hypothetical protein
LGRNQGGERKQHDGANGSQQRKWFSHRPAPDFLFVADSIASFGPAAGQLTHALHPALCQPVRKTSATIETPGAQPEIDRQGDNSRAVPGLQSDTTALRFRNAFRQGTLHRGNKRHHSG